MVAAEEAAEEAEAAAAAHASGAAAAPSWVLPALFCSTVMKAKIAKKPTSKPSSST